MTNHWLRNGLRNSPSDWSGAKSTVGNHPAREHKTVADGATEELGCHSGFGACNTPQTRTTSYERT
jgi:hypothetical protein